MWPQKYCINVIQTCYCHFGCNAQTISWISCRLGQTMGINVVRVSTEEELVGILSLHHKNLLHNLSEEEKQREGYVTAEYNLDLLKKMHSFSPSVIAKDGNEVVGYVLVATKEFYGNHPLLDDMFNCIDKIVYDGQLLGSTTYATCGQLCVDKGYRGQGLVQLMYRFYQEELKKHYQYCITDVARGNPRSLKAHLRTGFEVVSTIDYSGVVFDVILWNWRIKN